ncbi:MAG: hypothetical protein AAF959_22650 [Cyanobacteria bacterium P01_D01_bin.56]
MTLPSKVALTVEDRVSIAFIKPGDTLPTAYVIDSDNAATAGAGSLTLSLTSIDGVAATATDKVELESDSEIWFASSNTVAVDGANFVIGDRALTVDDGADGLPTNEIAVGSYFTIAGDTQIYQCVERSANAADYDIRTEPALKSAPPDNAAITVYNIVRLQPTTQFIRLTSTGVSVPVSGVTYAMAGPTSSRDTYQMRQFLGLATVNPAPAVASSEVVNMKFRTTLRGTTSFSLAVEGQKFAGNSGWREVAKPYLVDPDFSAYGVYAEYVGNDGDRTRDSGSLTDSGGTAAADEVKTYNVTFTADKAGNFQDWTR